jgi:hypothetical protein
VQKAAVAVLRQKKTAAVAVGRAAAGRAAGRAAAAVAVLRQKAAATFLERVVCQRAIGKMPAIRRPVPTGSHQREKQQQSAQPRRV